MCTPGLQSGDPTNDLSWMLLGYNRQLNGFGDDQLWSDVRLFNAESLAAAAFTLTNMRKLSSMAWVENDQHVKQDQWCLSCLF